MEYLSVRNYYAGLRQKLLVDVTAGTAAHYDRLLGYALRHIDNLCPCTELVVFRIHSNVDYPDWISRYCLLWHSHFRHKLAVKFATRVSRKWRPTGSATVDTGGLPDAGTGHPYGPGFEAMPSIKREDIRLRIWLLDSLSHLDDRDNRGCRYIGQDTNQARAMPGGPYYTGAAFGFGHLGTSIGKWTARIHLEPGESFTSASRNVCIGERQALFRTSAQDAVARPALQVSCLTRYTGPIGSDLGGPSPNIRRGARFHYAASPELVEAKYRWA